MVSDSTGKLLLVVYVSAPNVASILYVPAGTPVNVHVPLLSVTSSLVLTVAGVVELLVNVTLAPTIGSELSPVVIVKVTEYPVGVLVPLPPEPLPLPPESFPLPPEVFPPVSGLPSVTGSC